MDPVFRIVICEEGDPELYRDGKFLASWDKSQLKQRDGEPMVPAWMVSRMCELAFASGLDARSAEILKLLGGRS